MGRKTPFSNLAGRSFGLVLQIGYGRRFIWRPRWWRAGSAPISADLGKKLGFEHVLGPLEIVFECTVPTFPTFRRLSRVSTSVGAPACMGEYIESGRFMQTTVNLPDSLYQKSEALAASRGATVEQFIVEAVEKEVKGNLRGKRIRLLWRSRRGTACNPLNAAGNAGPVEFRL